MRRSLPLLAGGALCLIADVAAAWGLAIREPEALRRLAGGGASASGRNHRATPPHDQSAPAAAADKRATNVAHPDRELPNGPGLSALHRGWRDTSGRARAVLPSGSCRLVVLIFIRHDCPVTNATLPAVEALHREFGPKGVNVIGVHCDEHLDSAAARAHATEFGITFPVVLDPRHELAAATGATITPEAAVLDTRGRRAYLGRIDNLYAARGKRRPAATTHDLAAAVQALLDGKPPAATKTKGIGCYIRSR